MPKKNLTHAEFLMDYLKDRENACGYLNELMHDDGEGDFERLLFKGVQDIIKSNNLSKTESALDTETISLYEFLRMIEKLGLRASCAPIAEGAGGALCTSQPSE